MSDDLYPPGSVRGLLQTDLVTPKTREVLQQRLNTPQPVSSSFFDKETLALFQRVCARLFPRTGDQQAIDLVGAVIERLESGHSNGWRYDSLPPDGEAYGRGLHGFDESALALFKAQFIQLHAAEQDKVLQTVQDGTAPGSTWEMMPSSRFFEDLLAELTEIYYSHPLAQEEIGYVGMADAHGWQKIGLNQLEDWEPRPIGKPQPELSAGSAQDFQSGALPETALPVMRSYTLDEEIDAVIIGTGAGGAPLLARLAGAGLHVVALEAGPYWNPARDFATDERSQSKLFWNDERLSAGKTPLPFGNNNSGTGVGGTTLHYTGYVPRPQPDDFRLRTEFGVGADWPLSYADLESYYDELEWFLGVSGPSPYPWGPPRKRPFPLQPLPLNGVAQLMQRGCAALGIQTAPAANAALSGSYVQPGVGWRAACTNRGFCQAGCSTGAKASMDVTFIPLAIQAGAEIRPESFVTHFELDNADRITAVVYQQNGQTKRQHCRHVFLCAGGIETPRLLLMNHLANSSGQVGRNFMAHVGSQVWGQFEEDIRPYKGIPGALISEDTHRPAQADFAGGYLLQSIGVMPVTYASQLARGRGLWGQEMLDHMQGYNHVAGIDVLGDCLPYSHNCVELSDEKDARGLPKPRIQFSAGDNERSMAAHAEKLMRNIWAEAGAHDIWVYPRFAHLIGTCRMGTDATEAVVDPDGRSFDIPNLYISDNSIFSSALSVNPSLTIMALSLRIADRFLEQARRLEA